MQDEQNNQRKINTFLKHRRVFYKNNCYTFLKPQQFEIAKLIIKSLYNLYKCNQEQLFQSIKNPYEELVVSLAKKYNGLYSEIKKTNDKWVVKISQKRQDKGKKNPIMRKFYPHTANYTLYTLIPIFVYRKFYWSKNNKPNDELKLNSTGKLLAEEILKQEQEELK